MASGEPYPYHQIPYLMGNGPWAWPQPQTVRFGGWVCARCQRCFSPVITECPHCQPQDEMLPDEPTDCRPLQLGSGAVHVCPKPQAGGMCGCDDDEPQPPGVCMSRNCSC